MNGKTTHVSFNSETHLAETEPLYQYDYGQVLVFDDIELPDTYEVIFSNGTLREGKTAIGGPSGVEIPSEFLLTGCNVMAWLFVHDDENSGQVEYVVRIPVRPRSKLSEDEITDIEQTVLTNLIAVVNSLQDDLASMDAFIGRFSTRLNTLETKVTALENRVPALGGWKTD